MNREIKRWQYYNQLHQERFNKVKELFDKLYHNDLEHFFKERLQEPYDGLIDASKDGKALLKAYPALQQQHREVLSILKGNNFPKELLPAFPLSDLAQDLKDRKSVIEDDYIPVLKRIINQKRKQTKMARKPTEEEKTKREVEKALGYKPKT